MKPFKPNVMVLIGTGAQDGWPHRVVSVCFDRVAEGTDKTETLDRRYAAGRYCYSNVMANWPKHLRLVADAQCGKPR